jgi:uncharacterized protein (TIGR03083 family)
MAFDPHEQLAIVPIVARQSTLMAHAYHAWPAEYWERPTYCEGWTAADVIAHLATGAEFYTHVLTSGRTGQPALPWGATNLDEVRTIRAAAIRRLRSGGPQTLLRGFTDAAQQLQAVFESLHVDDVARVAWYPRGPIPIGQWIGMRLTELALHDWDIRQPHEATCNLSSVALPSLLTCLPEMQQRLLSYRLPHFPSGEYAMHVGATHWAFRLQDQQLTYHAESSATCRAALHTNAETLILLTLGRADFTSALEMGRCALTGEREAGMLFYGQLFGPYLSASATS